MLCASARQLSQGPFSRTLLIPDLESDQYLAELRPNTCYSSKISMDSFLHFEEPHPFSWELRYTQGSVVSVSCSLEPCLTVILGSGDLGHAVSVLLDPQRGQSPSYMVCFHISVD